MVIKNYVPNHFENKNFKHIWNIYLNKNFYYILCHKQNINKFQRAEIEL